MTHEQLRDFDIEKFQEDLISWFEAHKRDLPWRENKDPYRVWVSEIMLQQTRVDTVIPYFQAFMRHFPTIDALAEAEEEKVLKAWEGLGYYSRVRNLQTAVREVKEHYGGQVPATKEEISKLKGVGPYTAGAILSIAYGKPEPAVDGNVMRVLSRILLIEDDIAKAKTRKIFEGILYELISKENPSFFNQGLMELGALVCTPTSPGCLLCPVREHCRAYEAGMQSSLPVKAKKQKPKHKQIAALILRNEEGKVLIQRRPDTGLLAKLWQFPNEETTSLEKEKEELIHYFRKTFNLTVKIGAHVQTVEHIFSHLIWNIHVYEGMIVDGMVQEEDGVKWVSRQEIEDYPFPVSHQKIIAANV
ncbi:A/G-specific adenine glycosylase [Halalkalibacterium ligniniphilum]|uniref:A/G-specific adenine glycosylase n=2 Tax=Halalkalibacterium ligniniphilum TaxID=1134413 RepID=UPI0003462EBE|nr:A/G-specific adenine glycosylase [Halalkalibacterium ligniniphilum]